MSRPSLSRCWSAMLVAVLLIIGLFDAAHAADLPLPPTTFGPSPTNWDTVLSFDQFDPALGTLTSVEITLAGAISGDASYESTDPNPTTITLRLAASVALQRPNNNDILLVEPATTRTVSPGPYDGVDDFGGASGGTLFNLTGSASDTTVLTDPADLALFIGNGTIQLPASARGNSSDNGSGNLITEYTVRAETSVTVIYTYDPAAQPGILLQKTVYNGQDNGTSCPGSNLVTAPLGTLITYCFVVTNSGDTHLTDLTLVDPALGIALNDLQAAPGNPALPLAPGASLTYYYQTTLNGDLENTATVEGQPSDSGGTPINGQGRVSDSDDAEVRATITASVLVCKEDNLGNPLAGWEFEVEGPDDYEGTTDQTGCVTIPILLAGTYDISEQDQDGWQQITPPGGDDFENINIQNGSNLGPYTFVNAPAAIIRVCKVEDSTGQPLSGWQFNLTGPQNLSQSVGGSGCTNFSVTEAGDYTITEVLQPGWTQVSPANPNFYSVTVTGPISPGDLYPPTGAYTFRNRTETEVRITKVANPPVALDFNFTGDLGNFVLSGDGINNTIVITGVVPGDYDIEELLPPGWDLTSVTCNDNDSGDLDDNEFTIELDAQELLACTVTNTQRGRLVIEKSTTVASSDPFTFTVSGPGLPANPLTFDLQNGERFTVEVRPGQTYTIIEATDPRWVNTSATCSNGQAPGSGVSAGVNETVICSFVNAGRPGLTVIKQVENNFGGTATPADFTLTISGTGVLTSFAGSPNGVRVLLNPGAFEVNEAAVNGYVGSFAGDCSGTLALDQQAVCTVTNRDQPPSITIIKAATPADGSDFSFSSNLGGFTLDDAAVDDGDAFLSSQQFTNLQPGTYMISETVPSGWRLVDVTCVGDANDSSTWDGAAIATLDLDPAESLVCTFHNVQLATITLTKQVVNDHGGSAGPNDFGLRIGNTPVQSGVPLAVLPNVAYELNEMLLAGYNFVSITGDAGCPTALGGTVTPAPGESIACTITNDDQDGGGGQTGSIGDFVWTDANGDGIQNDGAASGLSGVTVNLYEENGTSVGQTTTDSQGNYGFGALPPGIYVVEFALPVNYGFTQPNAGGNDAADSDVDPTTGRTSSISLDPGEDDTSVDAGLLPSSGLLLNKTASESEIFPGEVLTYTLTFTNIGAVAATSVVLTETVPNFTTLLPARSTSGWVCANDATVAGTVCRFAAGELSPGAAQTVQFVVQVNEPLRVPQDGLIIFNTAWVGDENSGTPPTQHDRPTRIPPSPPTGLNEGEEPFTFNTWIFLPFISGDD